jgi:OmpA-OmpF porin, OOP family
MSIARRWGFPMLAIAACATCGTEATAASEPGWYYGLNGGRANADIVKSELDGDANSLIATAGPPLTSSSTLEDADTSWSIFFGYQFSQYFAFEAGYLNLGSFTYHYAGTADLTGFGGGANDPTTVDLTLDFKGYPVSAIGILPLGPVFDLHARAGVLFTSAEESFASTAGPARIGFSDSASSQDLFYGAGAAMNLGDSWSLSLDWIKYDKVGDGDTVAETDLDALSLSLIYRFGPF